MPQHPLGWRGRRLWQRFKQKGEALWVLMKAGRLTERDGADWEENERQKERCGNLLTQALCRRSWGGRMLFVLRFESSPWLLIGVTSDNLKSLNAHMNKVTAHVLPISSSCTAVKMISGETEIAVHDYSVCTLISYTQTSYLKKKKKGGNSRVTHTRAANFFMLLQADKQVFPTQVNWLHLCDQ